MKTVEYNRKFYKKCNNGTEICPLAEKSEGESNRKIAFVLQIIYSGLAWFVFGYDIKDESFFVSLLLFSAPLFFEYFFYHNNDKLIKGIYLIQKIIFFFGMCIGGLGGLTRILSLSFFENYAYIKVSEKFFICRGLMFNVNWVMIPLFISILFIFTHIFSLSSLVEEKAANNKIQNVV